MGHDNHQSEVALDWVMQHTIMRNNRQELHYGEEEYLEGVQSATHQDECMLLSIVQIMKALSAHSEFLRVSWDLCSSSLLCQGTARHQ
jgi:hypothetical protein